jgi:hypothetical protein
LIRLIPNLASCSANSASRLPLVVIVNSSSAPALRWRESR